MQMQAITAPLTPVVGSFVCALRRHSSLLMNGVKDMFIACLLRS